MNERKFFLVGIILLLLAISFMMVKPFLGYLIGAAILAFSLRPLHKFLKRLIPQKISGLIVVLFGISLVVIPFSYAIIAVFEDAQTLAEDFNQTELIDTDEIEQQFYDLTGREVDIESNIDALVNRFAETTLGSVSEFVRFMADFAIGFTLMIFIMYYLIVDGDRLIRWIKGVTPLPENIQDELYNGINKTTWAVIQGHVLVAIIQGLIAGLGLYLTNIPNYAFWTFIMVLLGFIPVVGTFIVWGPAAIYLFVTGESVLAALLALYGIVIVGLTDNFLRPYAVDRGANLHPAVILIGVIGGVYAFGAAGLFIGPIILGILKSMLLVFKNYYEDL